MSKAPSPASSPERRLAKYLAKITRDGDIDVAAVLAQVPVSSRPRVHGILSGLYRQVHRTAHKAAQSPTISTDPREFQAHVEALELEGGYENAVDTQTTFSLLKGGQKVPDFGQVLKAFTREELAAALTFQNPKLRLTTKGRSFYDLVNAMRRSGTMLGDCKVLGGSLFAQHGGKKTENWGARIVESPDEVELQDFDNTDYALDLRLGLFADHKKATGVRGADRWTYAQSLMEAAKEGRPIDSVNWTVLDEDPAMTDTEVPIGDWNSRLGWAMFDSVYPGKDDGHRFRRSVGGVIPNA